MTADGCIFLREDGIIICASAEREGKLCHIEAAANEGTVITVFYFQDRQDRTGLLFAVILRGRGVS